MGHHPLRFLLPHTERTQTETERKARETFLEQPGHTLSFLLKEGTTKAADDHLWQHLQRTNAAAGVGPGARAEDTIILRNGHTNSWYRLQKTRTRRPEPEDAMRDCLGWVEQLQTSIRNFSMLTREQRATCGIDATVHRTPPKTTTRRQRRRILRAGDAGRAIREHDSTLARETEATNILQTNAIYQLLRDDPILVLRGPGTTGQEQKTLRGAQLGQGPTNNTTARGNETTHTQRTATGRQRHPTREAEAAGETGHGVLRTTDRTEHDRDGQSETPQKNETETEHEHRRNPTKRTRVREPVEGQKHDQKYPKIPNREK